MKINTKNIVSITEANQNFSKVARLVDEKGLAVILKNNVPRYLVLEFNSVENEQNADDEDVIEISKRLMKKISRHTRCLQNETFIKKTNNFFTTSYN